MDWQTDEQGTQPGRWIPGAGDGEWTTSQPQARAGNRHRKRRRGLVTPLVAVAAVACAGSVGAFALHASSAGKQVGAPPAAPVVGSASPDTATGDASGASAGASASASATASASPTATAHPTPAHTTKPTARSGSGQTRPARTSTPQAPGGSGGGSGTTPAGAGNAYAVQQVLAVINQARAQAGLPAYTLTQGLTRSAGAHNAVMMSGCGLSHQCPGEADLGTRITDAGVHWGACGENIGEGGPMANTDAAIASMAVGLTKSMLAEQPPNDGHRRNILSSSFRHIGIVIQRTGDGTVYMTQDFSD